MNLCRNCMEYFKPHPNGQSREYCFKPECVVVWREVRKVQRVEATKKCRKKAVRSPRSGAVYCKKMKAGDPKRFCKWIKANGQVCGKLITNGNRNYCADCHSRASDGVPDFNYTYPGELQTEDMEFL